LSGALAVQNGLRNLITVAFQLCSKMRYQEGQRKQKGTKNELNTSALMCADDNLLA
jgi:hypothetical protein